MRVCCCGQVSELCDQVSQLQAEKEKLEGELDKQANQTHKQVSDTSLPRLCIVMEMMRTDPTAFLCDCSGNNAADSSPDV